MIKTFCTRCGGSIRELDAHALAGAGPHTDGGKPELGDWADLITGLDCPGTGDRRHEPGDPVLYGDAPARRDTGVDAGAMLTEVYWRVTYGNNAAGDTFDTHLLAWRAATPLRACTSMNTG